MQASQGISYKGSNYFVHSNQNKPYPSLSVKSPTSCTMHQSFETERLLFQNESLIF